MPLMTSPTDQTLISMSGRSVEFKAGEPTYVVPALAIEAYRLGAVPSPADEVPAEATTEVETSAPE